MNEDAKAMFQSRNFTLPDGWVLGEPQRSWQGGFGSSGIEKIIAHTKEMYKPIPASILKRLKQKFSDDFEHYGYTFDCNKKLPGGFD